METAGRAATARVARAAGAARHVAPARREYDAIVVGGGHNGLVASAYMAKAGMKVLCLERRHVIGGAAVTEELVPGFKFSRASYLAGLLRPQIVEDLNLKKFGFEYLTRDPSSFTPSLLQGPLRGRSLVLGSDASANYKSISQFSERDADAFRAYEEFLGRVRTLVSPLLDMAPPELGRGPWRDTVRTLRDVTELVRVGWRERETLVPFYELLTAPATHILNRWFEAEILRATLATDAVIGSMSSPSQPGSAYVLLHHVMGETAGRKGVWAYVRGGMGAVSTALRAAAEEAGAEVATDASVRRVVTERDADGQRCAVGVQLDADGSVVHAGSVLSNSNPYNTFLDLVPEEEQAFPREFLDHIRAADYSCGAFKINCAVDRLPDFECWPTADSGAPGPQHRGTVHFENEVAEIEQAYREASTGRPASRPVIEMTIPSSVDDTLAPPGCHVVQLFVQYAPYDLDPRVGSWADPAFKQAFVDCVFSVVEQYCPGFTRSIVGVDALSPLDLETIFGLHRGNIFHGALSLHQLAYARPKPGYSSYRTPLRGLYLCGSGAHPGGGVMGAPGRNCARIVISDSKR